MRAAKNIAIRLRRFKNIGLHLFVWLLSWITAFPKVKNIVVVINDETDSRKRRTKIAEMYCAAETGFENIVQKKNDEGNAWTTPVLQVITASDFAEYWEQRAQENVWSTRTEEASDNLHHPQHENMLATLAIGARFTENWPGNSDDEFLADDKYSSESAESDNWTKDLEDLYPGFEDPSAVSEESEKESADSDSDSYSDIDSHPAESTEQGGTTTYTE